MKSRLIYKSTWDIIDSLLRVGAVLYGPSITNLLYPARDTPYEEDNLIRAHYYSDCVENVDTLDDIMANLGYTEIESTNLSTYTTGKTKNTWFYTTYSLSPSVELSFTAPKVRVSIRPYISYAITITDSLCLVYDEDENEYRFFYAGVYLYYMGKWNLLHDVSCLGYIRVRTLRSRRLLANGKIRVTDTELNLEHTRDKFILRRGNKYIVFRKDNPYLR